MKVYRILCLSAVIALPQLASAATTADEQGFGEVKAILDFCSSVDPKDAATFHALQTSLLKGKSEQDFEKMEASGSFKQAYDQTKDALKKISKTVAVSNCASGSPTKSFKKIEPSPKGLPTRS